jgi:hypothetical protein
MEIPPFPHRIEIGNLENFIRTRLSQTAVMWPAQAIALVGYMCWPNDAAARSEVLTMMKNWPNEGDRASVPRRLPRIQHEWLRVADIVHKYWDLVAGQHQARRGGPSISKAIEVVDANTESRGTSKARLWHLWETYKDVAHLVTAAIVICAHARNTRRDEPFGLSEDQFLPFQMAMLMPDLVLCVALEFQRLGLGSASEPMSDTKAKLDPETLWRIPLDINVVPFAPPTRKISVKDIAVLNARRAGNRGRANRNKTTPVLG